MKKIIFISSIALLLLIPFASGFAADETPPTSPEPAINETGLTSPELTINETTPTASPETIADETTPIMSPEPVTNGTDAATSNYSQNADTSAQAQSLQKLGQSMIGKRIWSLTIASGQTASMGDKGAGLKSEIDSDLNNIKALKDEIAGLADLTALKEKIQSILDYRVYTTTLPKAHGLAATYNLKNFANKLTAYQELASYKLDQMAIADLNINEIKALVDEASGQIASGVNFVQLAEDKLNSLSPSDPDGAKILKNGVHDNMNNARAALKDAQKKLNQATAQIKEALIKAKAEAEAKAEAAAKATAEAKAKAEAEAKTETAEPAPANQ